jgi:hypothetical protein
VSLEENNKDGEEARSEDVLEVLLERYLPAIGQRIDNVVDIMPALFYDKEEMEYAELRRRFRRATGTGFKGFGYAERRYKKMDDPPVHLPVGRDIPRDAKVKVNREYFTQNSFYQSESYQKFYGFLVNRLRQSEIRKSLNSMMS